MANQIPPNTPQVTGQQSPPQTGHAGKAEYETVTVHGKKYKASKAKIFGLRAVRTLLGGKSKKLGSKIQARLNKHRVDGPDKASGQPAKTLLQQRNIVQATNTPTQFSRPEDFLVPHVRGVHNQLVYNGIGTETDTIGELRDLLSQLRTTDDLSNLRDALTQNGYSIGSNAIKEIDVRLGVLNPESAQPAPELTPQQQDIMEINKNLKTWASENLHGIVRIDPNSNPDNPSSLETFLKKRFRYRSTEGQLPSETAVRLPEVPGRLPEVRVHASQFSMAPGQPEMMLMQAPKPNAFGDTWNALFRNDARIVVDLTQLSELGKKVDRYYPETVGKTETHASGNETFTVQLKAKSTIESGVEQAQYTVTNTTTGESKDIQRLHFQKWVDKTGVDPETLGRLIDKTDQIAGPDGLVAVHCSAGVGRTGTFATARTARHTLAGQNLNREQVRSEITDLIKTGRSKRNPNFVQKDSQVETLLNYVSNLRNVDPGTPTTSASIGDDVDNDLYAKPDLVMKHQARRLKGQQSTSIENQPVYNNIPREQPAEAREQKPVQETSTEPLYANQTSTPSNTQALATDIQVIATRYNDGTYMVEPPGQSQPIFDEPTFLADVISLSRSPNAHQLEELRPYADALIKTGGVWQEVGEKLDGIINDHFSNRPESLVSNHHRPTGEVGSS